MIGIDMEKISRFEHWTDEGFKRIFTENEINPILSMLEEIGKMLHSISNKLTTNH